MAAPVDPATRKKVLRVVFFSLLLDLVCAFPFLHPQFFCETLADLLTRCTLHPEFPSRTSKLSLQADTWMADPSHSSYLSSQSYWSSTETSKRPKASPRRTKAPRSSHTSSHTSMPTRPPSHDPSTQDMILYYLAELWGVYSRSFPFRSHVSPSPQESS
jgi:hypothetical protein